MDNLYEISAELRGHLINAYWVLLIPYTVLTIVLAQLKPTEGKQTSNGNVIKRVIISIILLLSFGEVLRAIGIIGEAIVSQIDSIAQLMEVLEKGKAIVLESTGSWFNAKKAVIYVLNIVAYFIAYIGVYTASVLTKFVWAILFICSPLMILAYVNEKTAFVTSNLYRGLINVVLWKIIWSILGVLLLKLATSPDIEGFDNFFETALINLCIGVSMLFVPFTTKSLLTDGMSGAATMLAAVPAAATAQAAKGAIKKGVGGFKNRLFGTGRNIQDSFGQDNQNLMELEREYLNTPRSNLTNEYDEIPFPQESPEWLAKQDKNFNPRDSFVFPEQRLKGRIIDHDRSETPSWLEEENRNFHKSNYRP